MTPALTYTRVEILRALRNRRAFIFSLIFPLVMFLAIGTSFSDRAYGIDGLEYYMLGMMAFGSIMAVLSAGARIAIDRQLGWVTALRLTPLSTRSYFVAKVAVSLLMAVSSMALLLAAGLSQGVRVPVVDIIEIVGLMLVGLVPLGLVGVCLGHVGTPESMGPVIGGVASLLSMLGGAWFPVSGTLADIGRCLPSYWITRAGTYTLQDQAWPLQAWLVVAVWTVLTAGAAAWLYRHQQHAR